jgi:hypothetical protein
MNKFAAYPSTGSTGKLPINQQALMRGPPSQPGNYMSFGGNANITQSSLSYASRKNHEITSIESN